MAPLRDRSLFEQIVRKMNQKTQLFDKLNWIDQKDEACLAFSLNPKRIGEQVAALKAFGISLIISLLECPPDYDLLAEHFELEHFAIEDASPPSRAQVEAFAEGKGLTDVTTFFDALDESNLWDFARRPLDLDWLVGYWRSCGALGPLSEMLELSLRERLEEPDPQRSQHDPIDVGRAMAALERIGAALMLQGLQDIAVPDSSLEFSDSQAALDLAGVLPNWSGKDRAILMGRAVFDPSSAGLARLPADLVHDPRLSSHQDSAPDESESIG